MAMSPMSYHQYPPQHYSYQGMNGW
jgi:hypothetical protein